MNIVSRLLLALPLVFASAGCESGAVSASSSSGKSPAEVTAAPASGSPSTGAPPPNVATSRHGAPLEPSATIPLANLLSNPKAYAGQTVTTEGTVQRACSSKGCWMEIGSGGDACRITFKDYGFFVPTDAAGAMAKVQGRLDTRDVERAAVDHLEAEGARFRNKKPDGSATEVRLVASAVELTR